MSGCFFIAEAVDLQFVGTTVFCLKPRNGNGTVHSIHTHLPVGGPFATCYGDQSTFAGMDVMIARNFFGLFALVAGNEWTQACKNGTYVLSLRCRIQVFCHGLQNEMDLLFQCLRFHMPVFYRCI